MIRHLALLCFLVLMSTSFSAAAAALATTETPPFSPGERLIYELRWGVIPAGMAVFEVRPMSDVDGELAWHFVLTARTKGLVDRIYRVRDRIDAFADADLSRSLLYRTKQKEGSHERDVEVIFDWEAQQARYTNFGKPEEPVDIPDGTFCPLSVFYLFRCLDIDQGLTQVPVTDGKSCANGNIQIVGEEQITTPAGTFETVVVQPDMSQVGGVFQKSKDATLEIWFTKDARRLPVKFKSKVAVGNFNGRLIAIDSGD